jgi:hypothetical protein
MQYISELERSVTTLQVYRIYMHATSKFVAPTYYISKLKPIDTMHMNYSLIISKTKLTKCTRLELNYILARNG